MHYIEYKHGSTHIEFFNSIGGKETIYVNGQIVSQRTTIMGYNHRFEVIEDGEPARYVLRTKMGGPTLAQIDLIRNREYLLKNEIVPYGTRGEKDDKKLKEGLKLLRMFDLEGAKESFKHAIDADPQNPKIYFYLACVYSLLENKSEAFRLLQQALDQGLVDRELIIEEDALAYIRIQEEFDGFCIKNKIEWSH